MALQFAGWPERLSFAAKRAWQPQQEITAAILFALAVAVWKRDASALPAAVLAAVGGAVALYVARFGVELWKAPSLLASGQFAELEGSYERLYAESTRLRGAKTFQEAAPKVTRVTVSEVHRSPGCFDLLVMTAVQDGPLGVVGWQVTLLLESGARAVLRGIDLHHTLNGGLWELTARFPFDENVPNALALRDVKLVRLVGTDSRGRPVVLAPPEPLQLKRSWPDDIAGPSERESAREEYLRHLRESKDMAQLEAVRRAADEAATKQTLPGEKAYLAKVSLTAARSIASLSVAEAAALSVEQAAAFGVSVPTDGPFQITGTAAKPDIHLTPLFAILWEDCEQHTEFWSGYQFVVHDLGITNRSNQNMSLDLSVELKLKKPSLNSTPRTTVALRALPLTGRRVTYHDGGVLSVPAKETRTVNLSFMLEEGDALISWGRKNIAEDGHVLTIFDRVTGTSRQETFLVRSLPSSRNEEPPG